MEVLISSCAICVLFDDRRGKKKNHNKTMGFPVNRKLKFFVNLYGSLQDHSQTGQYGIA